MGVRETGYELRSLLYGRADCWALLEESGCGWLDGGCRSLMRALFLLLGDAGTPYQIVPSGDEGHSWHALVRVGNWYLDGDGVSTADELRHRWLEEEGLTGFVLRPFDPDAEAPDSSGEPGYCISPSAVAELSRLIGEAIGRERLLSLR